MYKLCLFKNEHDAKESVLLPRKYKVLKLVRTRLRSLNGKALKLLVIRN